MLHNPFATFGPCLLVSLCGAVERADFLVLENPASIRILSRYEQPLTSGEKSGFPPYAPLRIIAGETLLGDGITSAMEVRLEGHAYYLLGEGAGARRYRGCRAEGGREVVAGAELPCTRGAGPGGPSRRIRAGETLQMVFIHGNHAYVKRPGAKAEYLWCPSRGPFSEKAAEKEIGSAVAEAGLDPRLQSLLEARMEAANETYARFTVAFNELTGHSRQPPRWDCAYSRDGVRCRLQGGLRSEDLANSTGVLLEDLRNSLGGRSFDVTLGQGEFKILPRAGKKSTPP